MGEESRFWKLVSRWLSPDNLATLYHFQGLEPSGGSFVRTEPVPKIPDLHIGSSRTQQHLVIFLVERQAHHVF